MLGNYVYTILTVIVVDGTTGFKDLNVFLCLPFAENLITLYISIAKRARIRNHLKEKVLNDYNPALI